MAAARSFFTWPWASLPFPFRTAGPREVARTALPAGLGFRFTVLAAGRLRATAAAPLRFRELLAVPIPNHATVSYPPVST